MLPQPPFLISGNDRPEVVLSELLYGVTDVVLPDKCVACPAWCLARAKSSPYPLVAPSGAMVTGTVDKGRQRSIVC